MAMSRILGVWMVSVETYQRIALSLTQQEGKRSQLRGEWDAFEIQEQSRANVNLPNKDLSSDSARMPSRHRSMRTPTQPPIKNKH